jgi:hypothetical protein
MSQQTLHCQYQKCKKYDAVTPLNTEGRKLPLLTSQPSAEIALRHPRNTIIMPMLACKPCSQNSSGYLHNTRDLSTL